MLSIAKLPTVSKQTNDNSLIITEARKTHLSVKNRNNLMKINVSILSSISIWVVYLRSTVAELY